MNIKAKIAICKCGGCLKTAATDTEFDEKTLDEFVHLVELGYEVKSVPLEEARGITMCFRRCTEMPKLIIFQAATKIMPADVDLFHYFSILFNYPENTWFTPSDKKNEGYSICRHLAEHRLICQKNIPLWINASFGGTRRDFFYNKSILY